ncbi:MAG: chloride channel protein [Candidatus Eremiobacteraeota bacterium]|nr:chloride channel protein [Candidatus Eremiobacteraeota bacterium]MBC5802470.1 chloride channel protein [Candidatus Eremiobacteraeota bacterium]MBC5822627.1 chloride channel protein [Candidatus Eremiobacteraeota bacterium]
MRYVETDRGYRLDVGRISINQSTFLLLAAIIVGLGGGYGAVAFRYMIVAEQQLAFGYLAPALHVLGRAHVVAVLMIGGILTALIVTRFAREAKGHGVPEVMASVALQGGIMRPRVIAVKSLASATCIGFGGSCGREGPIVQIGSAIGSVLGQLVRAPTPIIRTLVACGAAAGISATFNAPIGGVFFASEVILGDFAPRSFATIVVASVVAAVIGRANFGNHPSFTASAFYLVSSAELGLYAVLGVIAAVWASAFVRLLYFCEDRFDAGRANPVLKAALGFGVVGIIGMWFPQVFGVGYNYVDAMLASHVPAGQSLLLAALKPLATSLTLGAGGSGGVFAPSLYTGAMLGNAFGRAVHDLFPSWTATSAAYGLVGMAAVFAAAAEAPITAIMIVFEMSNDYTIILPLMICTVIATLIGQRLLGNTIYELKLVRRGIDWARVRRPRPFTRVRVRTVQRTPEFVAAATQPISEIAHKLEHSPEFVVPVVENERFIGMVSASHLAAALLTHPGMPAGDLAQPAAAMLRQDDTLEQAAVAMADPQTPLLPVVDPASGKLLGILTRRDVLNAYRSRTDI